MKNRIEIGKTYNQITVIGVKEDSKKPYKVYNCRCEKCGKIFPQRGQEILEYQSRGCLECREKERIRKKEDDAKSHIGEVHGNLEIIGFSGIEKQNYHFAPIMECKCRKCGNITEIPLPRLNASQARECAECARKNLKIGREISKSAAVEGTSILSIDGRRQKNKNNSSGHNGVSKCYKSGKWRAYINFRRRQYYLGTYEKIEDAIQARKEAEKEMYGSFLDWYAQKFPEKWEKIQNRKK